MLKSRLSPMPTGLLVTFTRDEIVDLIAFLQSAPEAKGDANTQTPAPTRGGAQN